MNELELLKLWKAKAEALAQEHFEPNQAWLDDEAYGRYQELTGCIVALTELLREKRAEQAIPWQKFSKDSLPPKAKEGFEKQQGMSVRTLVCYTLDWLEDREQFVQFGRYNFKAERWFIEGSHGEFEVTHFCVLEKP